MKVIISFTFLANLWSFAFAENYLWGELKFGTTSDGSNINDVCSDDDMTKLDAAIPKAVQCVGDIMAHIEFTLGTPPEDGGRRLTDCGCTCSRECTMCRYYCRGWSCSARRLGAPGLFQSEERHLSCAPVMDWKEKQAVSVFNSVCYNDAINKSLMTTNCRDFLFENTDKKFYAQIN